jgi:integrase
MHGWDDRCGLSETPKWNSVRPVPIPRMTQEALEALLAIHRWGEPEPEDIVIWGRDRRTPLSKTAIPRMYKTALGRIGIPLAEQRRRVLVFHSHRYGFNTLLRSKIPDEQLRRVTGHKSLAMTDTYDKPGVEHLRDVA